MRLNNTKIGIRLAIGFGLVVSLCFFVGLVGIFQVLKLANDAAEIYDHPLTVSNAVRDIKADILTINEYMKDIALTRSAGQIKHFSAMIDDYEADALSRFDVVLDRYLGDLSDVEAAREAFYDWRETRESAISLGMQGKWEEVVSAEKGQITDHAKILEEKIQILSDFASGKATEFLSSARRSGNSARMAMISLLIATILASIVVAALITRGIVVPLAALSDSINIISKGILNRPIEIESNDELGKVASSLREMQTNLQHKADIADRIAQGDFRENVEPRGPEDTVALSINQIVNNFSEVVRQSKAIAAGDYRADVSLRSGNDELGHAIKSMFESLKEVVSRAKQVASGDYSGRLEPKSANDELAFALNQMTSALREVTQKNKLQTWIKTGQTELNEKMSGNLDEKSLADNVITFMSNYLDAQIGALYLAEEDSGSLKLASSYAYDKGENQRNSFEPGEGLVGQAAIEKTLISATDLPEDYVRITSGIGSSKPRNVVAAPLVHDKKNQGVMELGSFQDFSAAKIELLNSVCESIAISFNSARARDRVAKLLEQTRQQAMSLQAQQEELTQTNEELEAQTTALKESKNQLQAQQEELRVSNEELEERTKALEEQRDAVRRNNEQLEKTKADLALKAIDLENASKYKSEFLANMSHELRTPLNSILLLSRLLAENKNRNLTEKQMEYARTVNSSGIDLLNLIDEILDLSKIEAGKMQINLDDVDLQGLANDVERSFHEIAEDKNLIFKVEIASTTPKRIRTDVGRLQQILRNLLSNAFKFTAEGSVNLTIGRPGENVRPTLSGFDAESSIAFTVSDTGIGVPEEKHAAIFEAFQQADGTTSRKFGGTGLGLSISRKLANILGGELQLRSKKGEGTEFTLVIPENLNKKDTEKAKTSVARIEKEKPQAAPPQLVSETPYIEDDRENVRKDDKSLLIIEDDRSFAKTLRDLAREKGFKSLAAKTGEDGLRLVGLHKPNAIILDIGLPGIDGWEVMEQLKSNSATRHIPVHFISVYDNSLNAMRMGAVGYLKKPVNPEKLENAFCVIEEVIAKDVKKLLIVEDNEAERQGILGLIGNGDVTSVAVASAEEALELLKAEQFDCMVLDLHLQGLSGFELLEKIRQDKTMAKTPVIVYTGKDLTIDEEDKLRQYAESIIIKGARSPERLLAEITLFLHRVEANLPEDRRKILKMEHSKDAALKDKKILVIDDDMRNVFAIASVLEEKGAFVSAARTGKEGLRMLDENPDVDLVIMDIMMPEMDGCEAMRRIRKQPKYEKLPIIALTAKAMKEDRAKSIDSGANDYLAKPVDMQKLLSMLRVWLYK